MDLGERPFYLLVISLPMLISRGLREGAGQRVQDAQPRQHQPVIHPIERAPEEARKQSVSHRRSACPISRASPLPQMPEQLGGASGQYLRRGFLCLCVIKGFSSYPHET